MQRKRKFLTLEEMEALRQAEVSQSAVDRDSMEALVKYVYMAKHKKAPSSELIGGLIEKTVSYNGKTFTIITTLNKKDVEAFQADKLYAFA